MYSMSKFVSIETSFGLLLEYINYPCLEQLYIVDVVMKILSVYICQVIHVGAPADVESYIQETGRGGHDSNLSLATN